MLLRGAASARVAVRRSALTQSSSSSRSLARHWHLHEAAPPLHRGVASKAPTLLLAEQLYASDHCGHLHATGLDAASTSHCAAQRVQWLMEHSSGTRRVLALTADTNDRSRLLRHVDEHMAFHELERRGHAVAGVLQWCQHALEETGRNKRVLARGRIAAFVQHHAHELAHMQRRMTSPLATRRAVLDLLQHMELLEAEGVSPATYSAYALASDDAVQLELAQTYEQYRQLLATHNATSWHGVVLDVLERIRDDVDGQTFLDALLHGVTDVVVDDLHAMTPAMTKVVAHVCAHKRITSSLSVSRVLQASDDCPRSTLLAKELQQLDNNNNKNKSNNNKSNIAMLSVALANNIATSAVADEIRTLALRVLAPSTDEQPPPMTQVVECLAFATAAAEERGVAELIRKRLAIDPHERIAVLAPTFADAKRLALALAQLGIAVHNDDTNAVAATSDGHLFDEPGVNIVFSLLVALNDPNDTRHLYNVLRSDAFSLSPVLLSQLMALQQQRSDVALLDVLETFVATRGASLRRSDDYDTLALDAQLAVAAKFVTLIQQLRAECHVKSVQELVQTFLEATGRLDALLDPTTAADEREAIALADFLQELDAATRVVASQHVPFVVPYLLQLRTQPSVRATTAVEPPPFDSNRVMVQPLTTRNVQRLETHTLVLASMRDSKFPGRMSRITTPLPSELLSDPLPIQTRKAHVAECEALAFEALASATRLVVLSFATVATNGTKTESVSRVLLPLWRERSPAPAVVRDQSVPTSTSSTSSDRTNDGASDASLAYEPAHLSYSQIAEYLRCPQRYFLARVLQLSTGDASPAMAFGRALHEAIAAFATSVQTASDGLASLNTAAAEAQTVFDTTWDLSDRECVSLDQHSELRLRGHSALATFCTQHAARDVQHVEHAFAVDVPESNVLLRGVWDRVDRTADGAAVIYEFKSNMANAQRNVAALARASRQLSLYMFAYERVVGTAPHGAVLEIIGSASDGHDAGFVAYTPAVVDDALAAIAAAADGMRAGAFAPQPSFMECAFCPFAASACRAGADAAAAANVQP